MAPSVAGVAALEFQTSYVGDIEFSYIGSKEQKKKAKSNRALKQIEDVKEDLISADVPKAIELLSS